MGYGREKSVRVWESSCEYAASDSLTNVLQTSLIGALRWSRRNTDETKHISIKKLDKEESIIMKEQKRKWDESRSPQWKYFQENERKEKRKKLDM